MDATVYVYEEESGVQPSGFAGRRDQRVPDFETLQAEVEAWQERRDAAGSKIDWRFFARRMRASSSSDCTLHFRSNGLVADDLVVESWRPKSLRRRASRRVSFTEARTSSRGVCALGLGIRSGLLLERLPAFLLVRQRLPAAYSAFRRRRGLSS